MDRPCFGRTDPMLARRTRWRVLGVLSVASSLIAGMLALTGSGLTLADSVEPAFLTWEDEAYDDGLRHFLVRLDPIITVDAAGPFHLTDDGQIVADTPDYQQAVQALHAPD